MDMNSYLDRLIDLALEEDLGSAGDVTTSSLVPPGALGKAELWAYLPNVVPPKVARLSKSTGASETVLQVQGLAGDPRAWAFAFWGGDFFVFLERATDSSTRVWKVDGASGALTPVLADTGRTIVGAGVSTCAPVEIN